MSFTKRPVLKTLKPLVLIVICAAFTGCFSTKTLIDKSKNTPAAFSTETLNGIYKNHIGNNAQTGLWNILADNKTFKGDDTPVSENAFVKLELISATELRVSLIENDLVSKSMLFKGKITDDYFSIQKKMLLIPIPALMFHRERKTILGNNENGHLILTRGYKNAAWFLFMAGDYGGISSYDFERKKN